VSTFADLTPPYGTIVLDPPWQYVKGPRRERPVHGRRRGSPVADGRYSTMTHEEIAALPVGDLAADAAHLYLWVTNPKLFGHDHSGKVRSGPAPIDMLEGWGFRYITLLTWVKTGAPGLGWYYRGATEHVLFGVRGAATIDSALRMTNVIEAPRRGHSEKPPAAYDVIERVSPGPYVDLFSRQPRFGWDSWGFGYEGVL
jgi:N6-adenosine-specific RNA methylase IME4